MADLPRFFRVRQKFPRPKIANLDRAVHDQLRLCGVNQRVAANQVVAITAGSRGIANIAAIIRSCADFVKSISAVPIIVPAMGSHGGATAQGQLGVLASYGITEATMGCEIRSSMEVVEVTRAAEGFPIYFDKHAFDADHVLVVNRVKPHTRFTGPIESGLMKMMLIGLGKQRGAEIYHRAIMNYSFDQIVRLVARTVIERCNVVGGLAILENGYEETSDVVGLAPGEIELREPELLNRVKQWSPRLPFDYAEVLILNELGKNISGAGMDTNVVGRKYNDHAATGDEKPRIQNIYVRSLTEATHGNASGIGLAEFCHRRVVEEYDATITRMNCVTAGHTTGAMLPLDYPTDHEALKTVFGLAGLYSTEKVPAMWIQNTLHIAEVECSEGLWDAARENSEIEILSDPAPLEFDSTLDLVDRF